MRRRRAHISLALSLLGAVSLVSLLSPTVCEPATPSNTKFSFGKWFERIGGVKQGVEWKKSGAKTFDLIATEDITPGSAVVSIPPAFVLTSDLVDRSPVGQALKDLKPQQPLTLDFKFALLALFILTTKTVSPEVELLVPYFKTWTTECTNCYMFKKGSYNYLQHVQAIQSVKASQEEFLHVYHGYIVPLTESFPALFPPTKFTKARMQWAHCHVMSRAASSFILNGREEALVLLPGLDMVVHDFSQTGDRIIQLGNKNVGIQINHNVPKGEKIVLRAAQQMKTNLIILLFYGRVPSANPYDSVQVYIESRPEISALLNLAELPGILSVTSTVDVAAVMPVLRVMGMDRKVAIALSDKLKAVTSEESYDGDAEDELRDVVLALANTKGDREKEALRFGLRGTKQFLDSFETTVEEDESMLSLVDDKIKELAITYRISLKKLCRSWVEAFENALLDGREDL